MSLRRRASGRAHYNYFRDYDPALGGYVESDPIGLRGGLNTYGYVLANPVSFFDAQGLKVLFCNRKARGAFAWVDANHGYLWDTRNGKSCGAHGSSGSGMNGPQEAGPPTDECAEVPGSDGKEDEIMTCCSQAGKAPFIPFKNDCQAREGNCIEKSGLKNPGAPGGRFGPAFRYHFSLTYTRLWTIHQHR